MTRSAKPTNLTQQDFLRQAMAELGELFELGRPLTREEMCTRLGCPATTFAKWLNAPTSEDNSRAMPQVMWHHVREVIEHEKLKKKLRGKAHG